MTIPTDIAHAPDRKKLLRHLPLLFVLLYFGWHFDGVLFMTDGVADPDGFYNARYAQMLPERGLSRSFPWMHFTQLNDSFSDPYFLYHLILAPACRACEEPLVGAKIMSNVFLLALLAVFYFLLVRWRVPWPLFWMALLPICSSTYLERMLSVRAIVFSSSIMLLGAYFVVRRAFWPCFAVGFIYAWSYSFPLALVLIAVGSEAGRFWASGERTNIWRMPLAALSGVFAGLALNPYSPNSMNFLGTIARIAAGAGGLNREKIEIPNELIGLRFMDLVTFMPGFTLLFCLALAGALLLRTRCVRNRVLSPESGAILAVAGAWFVAMFVFIRMVEYAAPFSVLACALVGRDLFTAPAGEIGFLNLQAGTPSRLQSMLLLAPALFFFHAATASNCNQAKILDAAQRPYFDSDESWRDGRLFGKAAEWLKKNQKPKSVVLNMYFDDFAELFYDAPEFYFVSGMDPRLLFEHSPEKARVMEDMRTQKVPFDFARLGTMFDCDYLVLRRQRAQQFKQLQCELPPDRRVLPPAYEDGTALIYALRK